MKHVTTAILFGTFDILHKGHLNLFKQAKKKCDYLIIVIARDETVIRIKKKYSINSEKTRQKNVADQGVADKVILGNLKDKLAGIKKYKPDIIFLGYDQKAFTENLELKLAELEIKAKIVRLKSFKPHKYKTSILNNEK